MGQGDPGREVEHISEPKAVTDDGTREGQGKTEEREKHGGDRRWDPVTG